MLLDLEKDIVARLELCRQVLDVCENMARAASGITGGLDGPAAPESEMAVQRSLDELHCLAMSFK